MFMFRKKNKIKSTTKELGKEAKKFQAAYKEINETVKPEDINIQVIEAYSKKNNLDVSILTEAFETTLRRNALAAVRKVKASNDYTVLNLEQATEAFGFEMDDLNITFFSEE